jgi:formylglycine-generating enzyme required for sulfatase activity
MDEEVHWTTMAGVLNLADILQWLADRTRQHWRLPTQAEWER